MTLEYFHSILESELALTQKYIVAFSESEDRLANKAIRHIVKNKGKMLRPMLLILCGKYSHLTANANSAKDEGFTNDVAKAAAILELIQMSSLIHDDVLDQASQRRNKSTLNKLKGNRFAVLIGDYLVAQSLKNCYELVHQSDRLLDPAILYSFLESISQLILGEVQQNNFTNNDDKKDISSYFRIIGNKTASLFSLACFVGSKIGSGSADQSEALKQFGHHVGMAYQIIDDLRDYAFSMEVSGEKNFQDIKAGIKTLPIILANQVSSYGSQGKLNNSFNSQKELSENDKLEIIGILQRSGSIKKTLGEAKSHILKARLILYQLPENQYSILLGEFLNYLSNSGDAIVSDIHAATQN